MVVVVPSIYLQMNSAHSVHYFTTLTHIHFKGQLLMMLMVSISNGDQQPDCATIDKRKNSFSQ